ncbi:MAG TPA: two-component regulator propeller domain-containing protein [Blastocatellia bacterium]|nr:two-component regulator propeller domain-containing protein [Blastocatellia bacterium]
MSLAETKQSGSVILAVFLLALLPGVTRDAAAERLPIRTYTTADGLTRDHINRIAQDSRGFLWFCTSEGLSRFDGYEFINYGKEQGLPGRQVTDFLETRGGACWLGTNEGLCRFNTDPSLGAGGTGKPDPSRFVVYYPDDDPIKRYISAIYEDRAGTIWCGTGDGLYRLDQVDDQWVFSSVEITRDGRKVEGLSVQALVGDRKGALWISTPSALYRRLPDGVTEVYAGKEGLPIPRITAALLEDRDGRMWVGTTEGVYQLSPDARPGRAAVARVYAMKDGLTSNRITSVFQASQGDVWVGTEKGLNKLEGADDGGVRVKSYTSSNSLSDAFVLSMAEDHDGNLWIGTDTGGVMKLVFNGFTTYGEAEGLGETRIASIFEDRAGTLRMISSNGSINSFDGRKFSAAPLTLPKGIKYRGWGWYQTMLQDRAGDWWVSTGEGVVRYPKVSRPEELAHTRPKAIYTTRDGLPTNEIFRLFEDSRGDIWISTIQHADAMLTRWERATGSFHQYRPSSGVFDSAPSAFCEDAAGNLWIGFFTGGLSRYRDGRFTSFSQPDGLPPGLVRALYVDRAGRLWVGTADGGVARIDDPSAQRPTFITYTTAHGMSSNQVTCVTEDQQGNIYVGTGRGVNRLDPETGYIKQYTTADGLANNFINVSFRDREGALWFGTLQGSSRLVPQTARPTPPPPVFISGLQIAGVAQDISELGATEITGPELEASRNHIQIDFVGLGLAVGESLRYKYKLEGSGQDWSEATDQRTVNYPNLPPGAYRFLVLAISSDGTSSQSPATFTFKILPPFWQRGWFITLAVLAVASGAFAFDRYRVARLKELDAALTESQELTLQLTEQRAELRKANRSLALEAAVTGIISESATLNDAAPKILQAVCELAEWDAGKLWELEPQTRTLRCLVVWNREMNAAPVQDKDTTPAPPAGLPGAEPESGESESGEPVPVAGPDDPVNSPPPATAGAGSRSAFGFPILLGQEVLGILELFSRTTREHDTELLEMMSTIVSHIGQLIGRKRAEEGLRKSREDRLAELERVRRRIATDLHDDIGSGLTQITILSEVAHQQADRGDKQGLDPLARIIKVSNELVDSMSDIVWAINPKKDHLSDLSQRMRRFASDIFTARNIAFHFHAPNSENDIELGANLRREVFLIFKETVNNVVKHSSCSRADIEFKIDRDWLTLRISDDGKGFDAALAADSGSDRLAQGRGGNGIASMRRRTAEMGGEFEIVSSIGKGTESRFRVPVNR